MLDHYKSVMPHTNDSYNAFWLFANVSFIESIHLEALFGRSRFGKSIKVLKQVLMVTWYTS